MNYETLVTVIQKSGVVQRLLRNGRFIAASRFDMGGRNLIVSLHDVRTATIRPTDFTWTVDLVVDKGFHDRVENNVISIAAFQGNRELFERDLVMLKLAHT